MSRADDPLRAPVPVPHLSQLSTHWSLLQRAHSVGAERAAAQAEFLARYHGVVQRYLQACVRDTQVAEELSQEFALRFVGGRFRGVDPERGSFRTFLRTVLANLITDWRRRHARAPAPLRSDPPAQTDDTALTAAWQADLLQRAWSALSQSDPALHTVLAHKARHPDLTSDQAAHAIAPALGRAITSANLRQMLRRARLRFAELLYAEVVPLAASAEHDAVLAELAELHLLSYCRPFLTSDDSRPS
jgi:RNA polymerase sigma-70 factor (ECF subfamily)